MAETFWPSSEIRDITGEIEAITSETIRISCDGISKEYPLASGIKIICNGVTATWKSLTPITSEAFFEATISIDDTDHVVMIDGFYQGEECIIQGWFYNGGQFNLQLQPIEKTGLFCKAVKKGATLPENGWLHAGQLVFVVYNREGEIRGVYLPD